MHQSVLDWVSQKVRELNLANVSPVLEVGSMNVNGSVRPFFHGEYTGVDVCKGSGVDIVILDDKIPFEDEHFALVISTEMLEHAKDPHRIMTEMQGVGKRGSYLLLTTRSPGFPHHNPPDYNRFTKDQMKALLESVGYELVSIEDDPQLKPFPHQGVFVVARKP